MEVQENMAANRKEWILQEDHTRPIGDIDEITKACGEMTIEKVADLELQDIFDFWEDPENYNKIAGAIAIEKVSKPKEDGKTDGKAKQSSPNTAKRFVKRP